MLELDRFFPPKDGVEEVGDTFLREPRFNVGEAVYKPYAPQQYGKILKMGMPADPSERVRFSNRPFYFVRWKDGYEEWLWELSFKSLEKLVTDHEKKIRTHRKNIEKAHAL